MRTQTVAMLHAINCERHSVKLSLFWTDIFALRWEGTSYLVGTSRISPSAPAVFPKLVLTLQNTLTPQGLALFSERLPSQRFALSSAVASLDSVSLILPFMDSQSMVVHSIALDPHASFS